MPSGGTVVDKRIANGIAVTVTAVWAISFIADLFLKSYDPSPFIHMMMMGVAGAALGSAFWRGAGGGNGGGNGNGDKR